MAKRTDFAGASHHESYASTSQVDFRKRLLQMFLNTPLDVEELMTSFGLYIRGSALVKYLVLNDLYERVLRIPGCIMEFGTRWGQNLVVFENLRAIQEPFNKTRKIVGFDTFRGYAGGIAKDRKSAIFRKGAYQTTSRYEEYLRTLLEVHEGNNVLGHIRNRHEVIKGDVCSTVPKYFASNKGTIVALAYFDMGLYKPTKMALKTIKPHLVPGSILLLDELTWDESPGEATAFKEEFSRHEYVVEKCRLTPMRSIVTIR